MKYCIASRLYELDHPVWTSIYVDGGKQMDIFILYYRDIIDL